MRRARRCRCGLHDRDAGLSGQPARTCSKAICLSATCCCIESGMQHHPLTPMTRREPGARAAGAVHDGASGLIDYRVVARGAARDPRRGSASCAHDGVAHRHRRRDLQRRPAAPSAPLCATCRWSPPARASRSACPQTSASRRPTRPAALPPRARPARDRLGQLLASRRSGRSRPSSARAVPAFAIDPLRIAAGDDVAAEALRLGRRRCCARRPGARLRDRRARRRQGGAAAPRRRGRRARWSSGALAAIARGLVEARRAPARRRRRRDLGRVRAGARRRAAAHRRADRSRRAVVPRAAERRRRRACTWR